MLQERSLAECLFLLCDFRSTCFCWCWCCCPTCTPSTSGGTCRRNWPPPLPPADSWKPSLSSVPLTSRTLHSNLLQRSCEQRRQTLLFVKRMKWAVCSSWSWEPHSFSCRAASWGWNWCLVFLYRGEDKTAACGVGCMGLSDTEGQVLYRGEDGGMCSWVCETVLHGQCGVWDRPGQSRSGMGHGRMHSVPVPLSECIVYLSLCQNA